MARKPYNIKYFRVKAKKALRSNRRWLTKMDQEKPRGFNQAANRLHDEVFKEMDCLTCANCCKSMTPVFTAADRKRISKHLGMTENAFFEKYLTKQRDGDVVINQSGCPFLKPNNYCGIYEVRPACCAEFPHTNKRNFHDQLEVTRENVYYCPAVFQIVERLREIY